ncbi:MAG: tqsA 1 [Anaerosporomusa subterranea]|jgi:predicted PurR-regulated permease PerM|nr:tqsA 1 [Anaerosporomusa subterranea]
MPLSRSGWLRLAAVLLLFYMLWQASAIFLPLLLATVLAFILHPLVRLFRKIRLWPKTRTLPIEVAILLAFLVAGVVISMVITYIFMPFVGEFNQFIVNLPKLVDRVKQLTFSLGVSAQWANLPENVRLMIDNNLSNAAAYSLDIARRLINSIVGFAGQVVELIVVPVLAFYFLKDWPLMRDNFINAFPAIAHKKTRMIVDEAGLVVGGYIHGQLLVSVAMGVLVFLGMLTLDVDYPLVLGLIAALTEAIPVVGPIIGAIPALLLALLDSPSLALKVLAFYLVIHQLENNVLVPNIMKHTLELHPVTVIISLLIGAHLSGVIGMIVAVPAVAILKVLYKHLWHYQES